MSRTLTKLWLRCASALRTDRGANLVEYALLVAFIALACLSAIVLLGDENEESISTSASKISSASAN